MGKRIFILAGEPSGDLHGANLVKALHASSDGLEIACWGGDKMEAAGAKVLKHIDELAFMGFAEVVMNLPTILKNFKLCRSHIAEFKPDLVVLIDYPGFNLRMAKDIFELGIPQYYYISPQIWAWKESRVHKIKKYIQKVFVILPFEKDFYKKYDVDAEFVGHPLLDELKEITIKQPEYLAKKGIINQQKPVISLLPGSRTQEINTLLQLMVKLPKAFPDYHFICSKVAWQPESLYTACKENGIDIAEGDTYELLSISTAAIVTSGTATLETALLNVPQVVVYKGNWFSIWIARMLVKIKFISLVNLIMDREVVTELIQAQVNETGMKAELQKLLPGSKGREQVLRSYTELHQKLGTKGASTLVAKALLKRLESL